MPKPCIAALPAVLLLAAQLPAAAQAPRLPLADCYIVSELLRDASAEDEAERLTGICRDTNEETQALYDSRCLKSSPAGRAKADQEMAALARSFAYTPGSIAGILMEGRRRLTASSQQLLQAQIDANRSLQRSILLTMGGQAVASERVHNESRQRLLEAEQADERAALDFRQVRQRTAFLYMEEQVKARIAQGAAIRRHCR